MFKRWYKSKTIIGALVAIAGVILKDSGFNISGEKDAIVELIFQVMQIGGSAFAIYGRVKADGQITVKK